MEPIKILPKLEERLESSIKGNKQAMFITGFVWVGFFLYGVVYQETLTNIYSVMTFLFTMQFYLAAKIDSSRLELQYAMKEIREKKK